MNRETSDALKRAEELEKEMLPTKEDIRKQDREFQKEKKKLDRIIKKKCN